MEANQVHLVAAPVFCDSQQIINTLEPRFAGQIVRDVVEGNRHYRIHNDVAFIHPVTTAYFYMGTRPNANAAFDYPEPDSRVKAFGEHHGDSHIGYTSYVTACDGSRARRKFAQSPPR
jgi:hypothetical protein